VTGLVLGVIGHVDHGKTALVRALTGEDTDRLPEEKQRGISIALGFAHLSMGSEAGIDLIDMPGHERFVRTMISGATGIDAVLLVVAANEGIKPQTSEHIGIAALLGLGRAVVAISKADLVTPDQARRVADDTAALLAAAGITPYPPILTSTVTGAGIDALCRTLKALAESQAPHAEDGVAFLPIDRAFSIAGHGPVVTGTLQGAAVAAGDTLDLLPSGRTVRVKAIQLRHTRVAAARPGQRVALNLRDVDIAALKPGMVLAAPGTLGLSEWLTLSLRALDGAPALKNGARLRALCGTQELDVRLRLLDRDVLEAGQTAFAQLRCAETAVLPAGAPVILRLASPPQTVAGGKVLEPETRRQRRNCPLVLQRLADLRRLAPAAMMLAEVQRDGATSTTLKRLSLLSALAPPSVLTVLSTLPVVVTRSGLVVLRKELDRLLSQIPALLARHAPGLAREALLKDLPGTEPPVLDEALARLLKCAAIGKRGSQFVVPRFDDDGVRNEAERASRILETLRQGGLSPPDPSALVTDAQSKRAVDRLLRDGMIVRAVDSAKGREILFHRDAIEEARHRLTPLLARGPGLPVTAIGAALGISRKYSVPLLSHLDAIRFTRRIEDRRILGSPSPPA
jgi:selenocysteine-specific elongation factor